MNLSLFLFVLVGAGIMIVYDWVSVKQKGLQYNFQKGIPWYLFSVLIGGVLAYFIHEPIVQKLLLVMSVILCVHVFRGIKSITTVKTVALLILGSMMLTSCGGGGGVDPSDNVTWMQAWRHVSASFSYWLFILVSGVALGYHFYRVGRGNNGWTPENLIIAAVLVFAVFITIFVRPSEVAANTTVEQAARGVWIGY